MKNFSRTRSVPAVERPSLSRAFPAAGKLNVACCITVAGFVLALSGLCLLLRGQLAMGVFVLTLPPEEAESRREEILVAVALVNGGRVPARYTGK